VQVKHVSGPTRGLPFRSSVRRSTRSHEPTPEELAKELDMAPEEVVEVQETGHHLAAHPLGEDGDSEFGDLIEDSEAIAASDAVSFTPVQEQSVAENRA
jgi:DNA-directed RNA polymerase sigma subunit (sigma70/sigma32)